MSLSLGSFITEERGRDPESTNDEVRGAIHVVCLKHTCHTPKDSGTCQKIKSLLVITMK